MLNGTRCDLLGQWEAGYDTTALGGLADNVERIQGEIMEEPGFAADQLLGEGTADKTVVGWWIFSGRQIG